MESFLYEMDQDVRVHTDQDNNMWFCAKDVCNALGIINSRQIISNLDEDDKLQLEIVSKGRCMDHIHPPQIYSLNFVSECGLYQIIFRSEKEEAKKFKKWVCKDIIPQIRKTGRYETNAIVPKTEEVSNEFLCTLITSEQIKNNQPTLYHLAADLITQRVQQKTGITTVRIKDISQHMIDMRIDPKYITKYRSAVGRYVKTQYIETYNEEPPSSDKNITWNGQMVKVDDFHNGANRSVCWYPPEMYEQIKQWIKDYFRIKHPDLPINPTPLQLIQE